MVFHRLKISVFCAAVILGLYSCGAGLDKCIAITAISSTDEAADKTAAKAVDGNLSTRWSSAAADNQWIELDLGGTEKLIGIKLLWETAYGESYDVMVSEDKNRWTTAYTQPKGSGGVEDIDIQKVSARYVKMQCRKRGTGFGFSLFEIAVRTEREPFGIGQKEPEHIQKVNWDFSAVPERTIYLPKSWSGNKVFIAFNASLEEYDLSVNGSFVKTILSPKIPAEIDITEYARPGSENLFSVKLKNANGGNSVFKSVIIAKNTLAEVLNNTKNASNPKEFYQMTANMYSPGYFPLWLNDKQDYWTVVGTEDSFNESLLSSKGLIGSYTNGFSVIPFLYLNNELVNFTDADISLALEDNYLPIPSVTWKCKGVEYSEKLFGYGGKDNASTYIICTLKNLSSKAAAGKYILSVRPIEVNPPWMHGGMTVISAINSKENGNKIEINSNKGIIALSKPDTFGAKAFKDEDLLFGLIKGELSGKESVSDPAGSASAALSYEFSLAAGEEKEYLFILPLDGNINSAKIPSREEFMRDYAQAKALWQKRLNMIEINIPEPGIMDVLRSNIAYILIHRDGAALQPGSRSYERSWIRDGAFIQAALLRATEPEFAKQYLEWLAGTQTPDGEIPCILDSKTGKLVDYAKNWREYDASGEYVWAIYDYYSFTKDKEFLKKIFPTVEKALKFIEKLRAEMSDVRYAGTPMFGILPKNQSHEGYLDNPQQSLFDDFLSLKAWKEAQPLAKIAGRAELIPWMLKEEDDFRNCLLKDISIVQNQKNIRYIPASIGLAEFDAIGMSIMLFPTFEYRYLDMDNITYMLNRYYQDEFYKRLTAKGPVEFSPYEIRGAQSFFMLGEKEKGLNLVRYVFKGLRPKEWNHWSEVIPRDPTAPVYLGDMPHSWIGSIYINVIRCMFVYEDDYDRQLVMGSGIDEKWLEGNGISVKNLPTYYGKLSYSMKKEGGVIKVAFTGKLENPVNGFVLRNPANNKDIREVKVNGKKWEKFTKDTITFSKLPSSVEIIY
ncbi:MAG: discoidin domain-containing protein [Elusimicrobiota bacterium]